MEHSIHVTKHWIKSWRSTEEPIKFHKKEMASIISLRKCYRNISIYLMMTKIPLKRKHKKTTSFKLLFFRKLLKKIIFYRLSPDTSYMSHRFCSTLQADLELLCKCYNVLSLKISWLLLRSFIVKCILQIIVTDWQCLESKMKQGLPMLLLYTVLLDRQYWCFMLHLTVSFMWN